ncbi:MAG: MEDS domain-containing protein [Deltaproteobacteria bacterium]|nr:MEDS domain-containing protein [Deltaproteobacteria bacterium]
MGDFLQNSMERLSLHDHVCLFHKNPEERLSALVPYIRIGLARGEKCLLYCAEATGKEILEGLRYGGMDIGGALARGAMLATQGSTTLDARREFSPQELIAFFHSAAAVAVSEKYAGLRLCVDMSFVLGKDVPRERLIEYQRKLSAFLAGEKCLCMCLHGLTDSPADMLLDTLRAHPFVIHKGRLAGNFYFVPLTGETGRIEAGQVLEQRLDHIVERHDQLARIQRQALRLTRFRDIAASLLSHAAIPDLLSRIAEGVVSLGYRLCWIGMAKTDGSVDPAASAGDREGYLQENPVRWDDTPLGNGPVGLAIREGKPQIVRDVVRAPQFLPWRKQALDRGYLSVAAIPIREGDKVIGSLAVYAGTHDAFSREAIDELVAFVLQASLALQRVREYRQLSFSEERFRRLFDQIPAACFTYDTEGTIRHWNQHCRRIFGYSSEEAEGKSLLGLVGRSEDEAKTRKIVSRVLAGESFFNLEWENRTATGDNRWVLTNTSPFRGKSNDVETGISVNVDITDWIRMKEELRKELAQAQKMEAMGAFAAGIAHEFNNVLGAIMGYTSILEARLEAGDSNHATAEKIHRSVERATDLTRKLAGFARGGKSTVRPLSLGGIVSRMIPILAEKLDSAIEVRTSIDPCPAFVAGDEEQLGQSLLNLCLNARDSMPGGGTLTIETGVADLNAGEARSFHVKEPGKFAFIEVRDTGEGMTEEIQKRIFEPFFTTRREKGCAGMGLPMVYGVVKNHGGGIHVESAPGKGSLFRIHLPLASREQGRPGSPDAGFCPRGTETILIVDDEPEIRDMGTELLTALGYRTIVAEDGEVACRIFRERGGEIDLVLLDIIMPKMGGRETFHTLRKLAPGLPVLLSSGYSVEGLAQKILDEGANGFIQKPYGLQEISRMIRSILDTVGPDASGQAGTGA